MSRIEQKSAKEIAIANLNRRPMPIIAAVCILNKNVLAKK
jgi:hypothetical protein